MDSLSFPHCGHKKWENVALAYILPGITVCSCRFLSKMGVSLFCLLGAIPPQTCMNTGFFTFFNFFPE